MEQILEELRGCAVAAILAGMLLVFLLELFSGDGMTADFVRGFLRTIGGAPI